jgi:acyl-CoA reductase-like NAD-dependent aldehyde dehydrogenase
MSWELRGRQIQWNVRPFINGKYQRSKSSDRFTHLNPATETILYDVPPGDADDIDRAVTIARHRFDDGCWSNLPASHRAEILLKLANLIVANASNLALLDALEMGKPIQISLNEVQHLAPLLLRSWAGFADKVEGATSSTSAAILSINIYEPRGVIGAITPWNFPCVNAIYKFGPALAAGNTVVLKPSELSPSSALKLAELALEAGVPEGVFNVVPGLGSTVGTALALHRDVDLISFTGSTSTGRRIMELSGRSNAKALLLECGGKSPQIVFDDVTNLDSVADATAKSAFHNQGQVCSAHTRLLVHDAVRDKLLQKVLERATKYVPGDPLQDATTFGPLASPAQRTRVKKYIEHGIQAGASAVLRGRIQESGGCYVSPTVFDRVARSMAIAREEIFGPVLCVQSFSSEQEAIALANDTEYGLTATVWTKNLAIGRRVARLIRSGAVYVRTSGEETEGSVPILSREPCKGSGFGCELGMRGLQSYSTLKSISFSGS